MTELPLDFKSADERDKWIKDNVQYFTLVYFKGLGKYARTEYFTLEEAEEAARRTNDPHGRRGMIYAVAGEMNAFVKKT